MVMAQQTVQLQLRNLTETSSQSIARSFEDLNNSEWMDFGALGTPWSARALLLMSQSKRSCVLSVSDASCEDDILGVIGIMGLDNPHLSAEFWGMKINSGRKFRASTLLIPRLAIKIAFENLGLQALQAWAVEENKPSVISLTSAGFKVAGRHRYSFRKGDQFFDRMLLDVTRSDYSDFPTSYIPKFCKFSVTL